MKDPVGAPAGFAYTSILAAGVSYTIANGSDGNTYAWGYNLFGQLGDGTTTQRLLPVQVKVPQPRVTEVTFDDVPGTDLVDNSDGTWSVKSPVHVAGVVDVTVEWAIAGVPQEPVKYAGGYTYEEAPVAPTVTDPADQSVAAGSDALFSVTVAGEPAPVVSWEYSTDGVAWFDVSGHPGAVVAADGLTLTVTTESVFDGYQYRVTADNNEGTVTSAPAKLTVTTEDSSDGGTDGGDADSGNDDGGDSGGSDAGADGGDTGGDAGADGGDAGARGNAGSAGPGNEKPGASSTSGVTRPALASTGSETMAGLLAGGLALIAAAAVMFVVRRPTRHRS